MDARTIRRRHRQWFYMWPPPTATGTHTSTTALTSGTNPTTYGGTTLLTATITPASGPVPTGTVTFYDGASPISGAVPLSANVATFSTSALTGGTHSLTAKYSGDGYYTASTSNTVSQVVNKANTTTALNVTPASPQNSGTTLTFTATPTAGTTGTVTFQDGGVTISAAGNPATISGGTAVFTYSGLSVATHSLTAVYNGDGNYNGSTSSATSFTITAGGAVTLDPAHKTSANVVLSNGNLTATMSPAVTAPEQVRSTTSHTSGLYYIEVLINNNGGGTNFGWGICDSTFTLGSVFGGGDTHSITQYKDGNGYYNSAGIVAGNVATTGDRKQIAINMTTKKIWFAHNGSGTPGNWLPSSGDPAAGTGGYDYSASGLAANPIFFFFDFEAGEVNSAMTVNFGATSYTYTPPTGFGAW